MFMCRFRDRFQDQHPKIDDCAHAHFSWCLQTEARALLACACVSCPPPCDVSRGRDIFLQRHYQHTKHIKTTAASTTDYFKHVRIHHILLCTQSQRDPENQKKVHNQQSLCIYLFADRVKPPSRDCDSIRININWHNELGQHNIAISVDDCIFGYN